MKNELRVNGTQEFLGIEIPIVEGGFGDNKRCVLTRDIAMLHEVDLKRINEVIKNNIGEFESGVDIIDLKSVVSNDPLNKLGFSKEDIRKANNIYLLSESGYMTLCMFMRTKIAKEKRQQFKKEYFTMRETLRKLSKKQELALDLFEGGTGAIVAYKELLEIETIELKERHKLELEREIDGNNKILSGLQEVVNMLSIKGLNSALFRDWMIHRDLGKMIKFEGDKNRTFVPNEKFYEYVSKAGYSYTGTTFTNKPKVIYSTRFINRIQEEHMSSLIDFIKLNSVK